MKYFFKKSFICSLICCVIGLTGCGESKEKTVTQFLIRTSLITVSSLNFSEELDRKRAAYPYDIKKNPVEYNDMVIHLVKIISDEIVLLSAASDKKINITDQEAAAAEKEFKKEYPEDSFDQILLEEAISYPLWKKRFKRNMIIEKLIDQELKEKIEITPNDIVEFYNNNFETNQNSKGNATVLNKIEDERELVTRLRIQKTQEKYSGWIQNLYNTYPVEINEDKLKSFLIDIKKNKEYKNEKEN
ncbi:MAG: hypothetical protein PF690_05905 [Deltaproteobacteria bacterium]|nr:hypothetical protein [Deltaproteobacteria bacterium]